MLLLPPPAVNFVIASPPTYDQHELFESIFWYAPRADNYRHCLGRFVGNPYKDRVYADKLRRLRTLLEYREVPFEWETCRADHAAYEAQRKLTDEQKRQRKRSKALNIYNEQRDTINNSADLFKAEKLKELDVKYRVTIEAINRLYIL